MTLNINDADVFNKWRLVYDQLSDRDQKIFYENLAEKYPDQKHFKLAPIQTLLSRLPRQNFWKITELGGWDGSLAEFCLKNHEISMWHNMDIITRPQVCQDLRYKHSEVSFNFFCAEPMTVISSNEMLIATHMIEHLTDRDFIHLVRFIQEFDHVYFESPLKQSEKSDWNNYQGTHIMTYSWDQVEAIMSVFGYKVETLAEECKYFYRY